LDFTEKDKIPEIILNAAGEDPALAERLEDATEKPQKISHPKSKSLTISNATQRKSKTLTIADKLWAINAMEEMRKKGCKSPEKEMLIKYGPGTKGLPGTEGQVLRQSQLGRWLTKSKELSDTSTSIYSTCIYIQVA
jgi:hypothetical protein